MVKPGTASPFPLASPSGSPYSLSERINIATRPIHSQLNKLIIARLPLALPPYTDSPSIYISGLLHIAPIYNTFEQAWQSTLDLPRLTTTTSLNPNEGNFIEGVDLPIIIVPISTTGSLTTAHATNGSLRAHPILSHLRIEGLLRSERLRADIHILTGDPAQEIEEQLEAVSQNGKLAAFIAHIQQSLAVKPHVLIAYTWVLYMALFSGGRYLRASLESAGGLGVEFWKRELSPVRPYCENGPKFGELGKAPKDSRSRSKTGSSVCRPTPGMQFFNFVGNEDGEDIKLEFKKRLAEAEIFLTEGEKEDILAEAEMIFKFMIDIVGELDKVMGKDGELVTEQNTMSGRGILERKPKKDGYSTRGGEAFNRLPYQNFSKTSLWTALATILPALVALGVCLLWHILGRENL